MTYESPFKAYNIKTGEVEAVEIGQIKHAHWEKPVSVTINGWCDQVYPCSNCGNGNYCKTEYCPKCGAMMDNGSMPYKED